MKTKLEKIQTDLQNLRAQFEKPRKREYAKKISFCSRSEIKQMKISYREQYNALDDKINLTPEEKEQKKALRFKRDFFETLYESENFAEDKANLRDTAKDEEINLYQMVHFLELPLEDSRRYYNYRIKELDFAIERLGKVIQTL